MVTGKLRSERVCVSIMQNNNNIFYNAVLCNCFSAVSSENCNYSILFFLIFERTIYLNLFMKGKFTSKLYVTTY